MLSQNIVKNLILLEGNYPIAVKEESRKELFSSYNLWAKSHKALRYGDNSMDISKIDISIQNKVSFNEIAPYYNYIDRICRNTLAGKNNAEIIRLDLEEVLRNEKKFLELMNKITFQFALEARAEVVSLKNYELIFFIITIFVLLFEAVYIFSPILEQTRHLFSNYFKLNQDLTIAIKNIQEKDVKLQIEQRNSIKQIILAEETERLRIATELHDGLGHLLSSLKIDFENITEDGLLEKEKQKIHKLILSNVDLITSEIRNISYNLMPATLSEFGIIKCIEQYILKIESSSSPKISFIHNNKDNIRLAQFKKILIYRITQELLNNAIKHSNATEIVIQLLYHEDNLILMVEDNGQGYNYDEKLTKSITSNIGMGLRNIKTRLYSIGATVEVDSEQGHGSTTTIQIPYTS